MPICGFGKATADLISSSACLSVIAVLLNRPQRREILSSLIHLGLDSIFDRPRSVLTLLSILFNSTTQFRD
jgi:hypothetical protein